MYLKLALFTFSTLMASSALASTLDVSAEGKGRLTWAVDNASVFWRGADLWLLSGDDQPITLTLPDEAKNRLGIVAQENLQVRGGQGVRLSFKKPLVFDVVQQEGRFIFEPTTKPAPRPALVNFYRGPNTLQWHAPQAGEMLRAFSPTTKETYPALTSKSLAGTATKTQQTEVQWLPTLLGAVMVHRAGQPMRITGSASEGFSLNVVPPPPRANQGTYADDLAPLMAMFPLSKKQRSSFTEAMAQAQNAVLEVQRAATAVLTPPTVPTPQAEAPTSAILPQAPSVPALGEVVVSTEDVGPLPTVTSPLPQAIPAVPPTPKRPLVELAQRLSGVPFHEAIRAAQLAFVGAASDDDRQAAILRWAEVLFIYERYADAVGLLSTLPQDPESKLPLALEPRLLQIAAQMMMGRYPQAEASLKTVTLNSPEFQLWQAANSAALGRYTEAMSGFKAQAELLKTYPMPVQRRVEVLALETAYHLGQFDALLEQADIIATRDGEALLPEVMVLQGEALLKKGSLDAAKEVFSSVENATSLKARTQAGIHLTQLALDRGEISPEEAFSRFEDLRFAWRGDVIEQNLTFDLANLYLSHSKYVEALELLKYFTIAFPTAPQTETAAKMLTDIFQQLFTTDLAEQVLDPLSQLALYYEFRELTPPGPQGDAIMKRIVEKLADTSLYPRAIELLERLINFRLQTAADRAAAGLTLAELHYANRSYQEGLQALNLTSTTGLLPADLVQKRQMMQGRLHLALNRFNDALNAVQPLQGKDADYLRAAVAWSNNNYPEVIKFLTPYFANREVAADWQTPDHVALMQLALAYALERQPTELTRLYTNFNQEISLLKLEGAFQFLRDLAGDGTNTAETQDLWQSVLQALSTVNNFADFYDQFRAMRFSRPDSKALGADSTEPGPVAPPNL